MSQHEATRNVYVCPHHRCIGCGITASSCGGLLFHCDSCVYSYCDRCIPDDAAFLHRNKHYEDNLNFFDTSAAFILCSDLCKEAAKQDGTWTEHTDVPRRKNPKSLNLNKYFSSLDEGNSIIEAEHKENQKVNETPLTEAQKVMKQLADVSAPGWLY